MAPNLLRGLCSLAAALVVGALSMAGLWYVPDLAWAQGIAAAGATIVGIILIPLLPRISRWWVAALLLAIVIILATGGFWFSLDRWGISDWDYYFSLHETIRRTVIDHHQLPMWNPYTCGGTAALGDPEFSLFTPTFMLELLLGIPHGLRAAIYLATITGGLGMLLLGKRVGLSVYGALLAAIAYSLGSVNLLEIVEGHPNIFAAGWIPWIFWAWLGAYRTAYRKELDELSTKRVTLRGSPSERLELLVKPSAGGAGADRTRLTTLFIKLFSLMNMEAILCGVFLAITFYQGGIYLLMYTGLAFIVLPWLTRQPRRAYLVTLQAGMWALGLAALKLVPVLLWLRQFQDEMYAGSKYTLPHLYQIFFGRYLHDAEVFFNQGSGWHEYGAYLGGVVALLVIISLGQLRRSRLVRGLVIAACLAIVVSSTGPLLEPLFDHAPFLPRSNISRLVLFAVLPLALLAGMGLDTLRHKVGQRYQRLVTTLVVGALAIDVMTLAYALSLQAFVLPPVVPVVAPATAPIAFTAHAYKYRHHGDDYNRAYAATLAGYGTLSYCSVLTPPPMIRTIHDEVDNGYVSLSSERATAYVTTWSPNNVIISVETPEATDVVLNTNYAQGWYVNEAPAHNIVGRAATKVSPGTHRLEFRYVTPGFTTGAVITMLTLTLVALRVWWPILQKKRS